MIAAQQEVEDELILSNMYNGPTQSSTYLARTCYIIRYRNFFTDMFQCLDIVRNSIRKVFV